ncbi:hypothetical protein POTOM_045486 [Populus tomentosa]|uniref:(S)-ureidoglycine aminohydrolase cupin domain-containing protein n=1 Tax=Populus tomentosa TaxID=118781 RepID=A0A8X7YHU1_POPTO|nr:hypothetical protein POTOM_045486 [Populus tomentosa]
MACASGSSTSLLILLNQSRLGPQSQKGQQRIDSSISFGASLPFSSARRRTKVGLRRMAKPIVKAETLTIEKSGIKVVRNPPESKLTELGVRKWPKWGCPPSKFPWTYSAKETCYLLEGKVKVYPDGAEEPVEITAGDLVEFPKGMSCTWDVSVGVDKHYNFE